MYCIPFIRDGYIKRFSCVNWNIVCHSFHTDTIQLIRIAHFTPYRLPCRATFSTCYIRQDTSILCQPANRSAIVPCKLSGFQVMLYLIIRPRRKAIYMTLLVFPPYGSILTCKGSALYLETCASMVSYAYCYRPICTVIFNPTAF